MIKKVVLFSMIFISILSCTPNAKPYETISLTINSEFTSTAYIWWSEKEGFFYRTPITIESNTNRVYNLTTGAGNYNFYRTSSQTIIEPVTNILHIPNVKQGSSIAIFVSTNLSLTNNSL